MAKTAVKWVCSNCGYETARYIGRCPDCGSWGSLTEEIERKESASLQQRSSSFQDDEGACLINEIEISESIRTSSGFEEFDRVLGGGLVQGSIILIAGDPGIGKSTLTLQTAGNICRQNKKLLYVCAEESAAQVKLRAQRLNVNTDNLYVYSKTNLEAVINHIDELKPEFLVVDSVQSVYMPEMSSSPGSVSQIRECTNRLMNIAKSRNITAIIIGHVTKEGNIAGPKILEHMVDTVINFEGDRYKTCRLLKSVKNRFGSTDEIGVFNMEENGLAEVINPSMLFMQERGSKAAPGSVIVAANEGTRAILAEIQALAAPSFYPAPRRAAVGLDFNRLLQIIAVLEKRIGINLSKYDIYVNAAGGIEIDEPAADLGIALAVVSCFRNIPADNSSVMIGEITLSGGIKNVPCIEKRIYEAQKLGFKRVIAPKFQHKKDSGFDVEIIETERLMDAIAECFS